MDFNEAIPALIKALNNHTAALTAFVNASGKAPAAAAAGAAAKPGAAASPKPKPAGKKATTVDDIAAAFGAYLGIKDKAEREVRKVNVKAIVDYFGAPKATEIDPASFDEALGYLQQYIDGDTPDFDGGGEDGGEDEALV